MNCHELIEAALERAEDGKKNGAWRLFSQALEASGDDRGLVLFEMGRFKFFCGEYEKAINFFLEAYSLGYERETIREIIFEAFYKPNEEEIKSVYEKNKHILMDYPYILDNRFNTYDDLEFIFVPVTEQRMVIYSKESQEFFSDYFKNSSTVETLDRKAGEITLLVDEYLGNNILKIKNVTYDSNRYDEMRNAIYLVYGNRIEFENYLQVMDLSEIIEDSRAVFLFGEREVCLWFSELMYQTPSVVLSGKNASIDALKIINEIISNRDENFVKDEHIIEEHYKKIAKTGVLSRIKTGCPRIYIPTSRFTTALQYHARDCKLALEELGCEVLLNIENNDLQRYNGYKRTNDLAKFVPDLIMSIDHFRWDSDPPELVYVTWIQDPLPWIMNFETPKRLKEMDVILDAFFSADDLTNYGYPKQKLLKGPMVTNDKLYYEREKDEILYKQYSADIVAFSNAGDPEKGFSDFCKGIQSLIEENKKVKTMFYNLYVKLYEDAYNEINYHSSKQYIDLIKAEFDKNGWSLVEEGLQNIAERFRHTVGHRILRSVPLEWLAEKGYDLKLYGDEWVNHKKLKKYAMGRAQNGEMLSKIIGYSRIVIGTNAAVSTHPRVGESFLSGSLYIAAEIPKGCDYGDITEFLRRGEEILLFKDKEELFKLVDYYLSHEEQRLEFIENACIGIKRDLTYKALMKKMLEEIPVILEKEMVEKS